MRASACQRALTKKWITLWGSGAPQVGDLRLFEDGSKRGGTLVSNAVAAETAKQGDGERASVSTGADTKANTRELV